MRINVVSAPTTELISVAAVREHCKIEHQLELALLTGWIQTAREQCEHKTDRSVAQWQYLATFDAWPTSFYFPRPPVSAIDSVTYDDPDGNEQTLDGAEALIGGDRLYPCLSLPADLPTTNGRPDCVRIAFTTGYTPETLPGSLRSWMLAFISSLNRFRQTHGEEQIQSTFVDSLLDSQDIPGV